MEDVKAKTVYIAAEIINDGYNVERLWTCPPEHEHTTPGEAAPCLFSKEYGNLHGDVGVLALCGDRLPPRVLTVEEQSEVDQYIKSRYQQKTD